MIDEITRNLRESSFSENSIDYASYCINHLLSIVLKGVAVHVVDFC